MRPQIACIGTIGLVLACQTPHFGANSADQLAPTSECFEKMVYGLSGPEMEGRGIGTRGLEEAERGLVEIYELLGLESATETYRQPFDVVTGVSLGPRNTLEWSSDAAQVEEDFMPLEFSDSGNFEAPVVFAGYGIVAEELDYDDYRHVDVAGKIVLAMRYEPRENDEESPFDGKRASRFSDLRYKALRAREAGATALVLVNPPGEEEDRLRSLGTVGPVSKAGLPVLQVRRDVVSRWLAPSGHDLAILQARIDAELEPLSFEIPSLTLRGRIDLRVTHHPVANVVGIWPGRGALAREAVVVGAHYDHLGYGGPSSMAPGSRDIHPGADDNASGVAAMVCGVAGVDDETQGGAAERRTLLVIAFTAEEIGLAGSSHYVAHPVIPIAQTTAMVNLDMVGNVRDDEIDALGADSSPDWRNLLEAAASRHGLSVRAGGDGYGPSDQLPFYAEGVPVIHFFTGAHSRYHTPDDVPDSLNLDGGARIALLLRDLLIDLLHREDALAYRRADNSSLMLGDHRGYGSYLGTIPDYGEMMNSTGGVLLAGVRTAGPADRAGVRKNDRIIKMAGVGIQNLYDMTFVLRDHRPGDIIEIELIRNGERIVVRATLGLRGESESNSPLEHPHGSAKAEDSEPPSSRK